jgi:hypothetical protein
MLSYCNADHATRYRRRRAVARLGGLIDEQALARNRFCPWCGTWVPTRNAAAANVVGLPVTFTPNPQHFPEAHVRAQLRRVGVRDGRVVGELVLPSGAVLVERLDAERIADAAGCRVQLDHVVGRTGKR